MHTKCCSENLKEIDNSHDLGVDGEVIIQWTGRLSWTQ
jgi:hypothetical protein